MKSPMQNNCNVIPLCYLWSLTRTDNMHGAKDGTHYRYALFIDRIKAAE